MWRFLLPPLFATTVAVILLFAGVRSDAQSASGVSEPADDIVGNAARSHDSPPLPTPSPPSQGPSVSGVAERPQEARDARDDRATDLRHQVSDLQDLVAQVNQQLAQRKAQNPGAVAGEQHGAPEAPQPDDLQRQDNELHNELLGLITQLQQELQLEEQSPPVMDAAEQQERQAARDALKHEIADLQREDNELQGLMTHRGAAVAQREPERPPASRTDGTPDAGQEQTSGDTPEHQAADLRSQIADLQRQDAALQSQLAAHRQELAERTHELDVARAEADNLRQGLDTLRRQRQEDVPQGQPDYSAITREIVEGSEEQSS
jgi:chromosome segregation ATPase